MNDNARRLLDAVENDDSFTWTRLIPSRYVSHSGSVDVEGLGTLTHVESWNAFDEGNEEITIIFQHAGRLYRVVVVNDSWNDNNGLVNEWYSFDEVEPYEVTVTKYREVR